MSWGYLINLLTAGLILFSSCSRVIEGTIEEETRHPKTPFGRYEIKLKDVEIDGESVTINRPFIIDGSRPGYYHGKAIEKDNDMHPTAYIIAKFTEESDGFYCDEILRYTGP